MPHSQVRRYANISVDGTDFTGNLVDATPPDPSWNVGTSAAGRGMDYPIFNRLNPLEWTYRFEGDYREMRDKGTEVTIEYTEFLTTPDSDDEIEVDYDITGVLIAAPRGPLPANQTGVPVNDFTMRVLSYKETHGGEIEWDLDITTNPPKFIHKGKSIIPGTSTVTPTGR